MSDSDKLNWEFDWAFENGAWPKTFSSVSECMVWYRPIAHPFVITDAALIDGDGGVLLIHNGWEYKLIEAKNVNRITSARQHEGEELNAQEQHEFNLAQLGRKG